MKIIRGDYPGASEFAYFDKDVHAMTLEECRSLLECILHRAAPGDPNSQLVYRELEIAEQCHKEGWAVVEAEAARKIALLTNDPRDVARAIAMRAGKPLK